MSNRVQKARLKSNKLEAQVHSERILRSSKAPKMAVKPSQPDKGSFDELKEILRKQNEYMETQFKEVKANVRVTDDKITAINENLCSVQSEVGHLTEQQVVGEEKIATLEARLEQAEKLIEYMEDKLAKNQVSIDELTEKAQISEEVNNRLTFLEGFRETSLKRDEASEQQQRKMNLWVYGLPETEENEDTWKRVRWFMVEVLELDIAVVDNMDIRNTHRVGDKKKTKGIRPTIVAFLKWTERQVVLRASIKVASYNTKNETRFAVKTDLAPVAREKRKSYQAISTKIRENNEGLARACDDGKGKVWLEMRPDTKVKWVKHDNPPAKYMHMVNTNPYGIPKLVIQQN